MQFSGPGLRRIRQHARDDWSEGFEEVMDGKAGRWEWPSGRTCSRRPAAGNEEELLCLVNDAISLLLQLARVLHGSSSRASSGVLAARRFSMGRMTRSVCKQRKIPDPSVKLFRIARNTLIEARRCPILFIGLSSRDKRRCLCSDDKFTPGYPPPWYSASGSTVKYTCNVR